MPYDSRFGPAAQTPAARTWVLKQMQDVLPALRKATPAAHALYARYVAGELSWAEMRHFLDGEPG
jgi:hypothetical protein